VTPPREEVCDLAEQEAEHERQGSRETRVTLEVRRPERAEMWLCSHLPDRAVTQVSGHRGPAIERLFCLPRRTHLSETAEQKLT